MTYKINKFYFLLIFIQFFSFKVIADDGIKWSELRFFLSTNTLATSPTALNNLTAADNVQKLSDLTGIGLEADAQLKPWLKIGTRIKGIWNSVYPPNPPSPATAYLQVSQYSGGVLVRVPIVNNDWLLFDTFAEVGVANTKIDVQTISSGKGTFSKESGFYQRAGVSAGIGGPAIKFYLEAGQEWNNLSGMSFQGTLNQNVSSVDLTGSYYAFGLIFSGIPSWIKVGGFSTK